MRVLDSIRKLIKPQQEEEARENIYEGIGICEPFTALDNEQMRSFVSKLVESTSLQESEKRAFEELWYTICIDIEGFGNNVWNLKKGIFVVYEEDGIKAGYEKKSSKDIDNDAGFIEGRVTFTFSTKEGGLVVHQNDRNKKIFLAYTSKEISERLFKAFREAEIEVLELKKQNNLAEYRVQVDSERKSNEMKGKKPIIKKLEEGER